jgi:hypothetical protein
MPTRIVLRETEAPSQLSPRKRGIVSDCFSPDEETQMGRVAAQMESSAPTPLSPRASSRRIVGFRSSIIRAIPQNAQESKKEKGLSMTDIRASPRLVGYLFQLLASTVMLISVIQFYRDGEQANIQNINFVNFLFESDDDVLSDGSRQFYNSVNGLVYYWKLVGSVIVGSLGALISLLILLMHFDTVCLPRVWFMVFRDGSRIELCLLSLMLLFWGAGLYVCTSSLSVGEAQANVFFTSWIAFCSAALNCGVWRVSAGLPSIAEQASHHHRETTYNWLWTLLFVFTFAAAATDIYFNRDEIAPLKLKGKELDLSLRDWIMVLSIIWSFVFVCVAALLLNHYMTKSLEIRLYGGKSRFVLGWRQLEGVVILGMVGTFFWIIYEHTGVDGLVNGLNNAYFAVWGSFFNSVFTFGTWLRENKNIEYIVRDEEDEPDS